MSRRGAVTLFSLFAIFCGPLAGSAAASSGSFPPTVTNPFPPFIGSTLVATLNAGALPGDALTWETCGAHQLRDVLSATSSSYPLQATDSGDEVCAVELDITGAVDGISDPVGPVGPAPSLNAAGAAVTQGQALLVSHGAWGAGASGPTDTWYRCDAAAANCVQIHGASGATYTAARADVGSTIEAWETATSAGGTSLTVPTAPTGLVLATAPATTTPQTVIGTPQVGATLTASPAGWSNQPTSFTYQWDRCSNGTCTAITGATGSTYVPVTADVGDTLVVFVTGAVDPGTSYGSVGSPYPSYPTNPVLGVSTSTEPGPGPSPIVKVRRSHARGRLTATMRWTFRYAPSYTQISTLAVEGPALGSTIATRCTGNGCPFKVHRIKVRKLKRCRSKATGHCRAPRQVNLVRQFRGHNLAVGSKVTVAITHAFDIGKYYRFVVRRRRGPSVKISCLAPGSLIPGKNCTGL